MKTIKEIITAEKRSWIEGYSVSDMLDRIEAGVTKHIAELEATNKELMCAMREWYEDGFNRGDCGELIVKHGGEA